MTKTIEELIDLSGKVAIITGGALGIGRAIVRRLHEAGATVVIADINEEAARTLESELNNKRANSAITILTDVSDANQIAQLSEKTVNRFGRIDILINNAGIYPFQLFADADSSLLQKVLDINIKGVVLLTKHAVDQMKLQGSGKIINITSIDALHPSAPGLSFYDASKHAVWGLTKNIALELAHDNITVNAIAPGGINTEGVAAMGGADKETVETAMASIPMGRMGEPDEIGKVALFLASELSSYVTGSQFVVDGGRLLA